MGGRLIHIDADTGLHSDDGPFRSYQLQSEGETLIELLENALIWEIDQDGGEHEGQRVYDYSRGDLVRVCELMITRAYLDTMEKDLEGECA